MRVTPFWYVVFRRVIDGTQYAKCWYEYWYYWYAVRINSVISYADIIFFTLKRSNILHETQHT